MSTSPVKQRLRLTYAKLGALKYTSNLDIAKVWERTLRRADLPILYTQGFNTRPRMSLASPLPLGITSECELLDILLRERITPAGWIERIQAVSPDGLQVIEIEEIDIKAPALQTMVRGADYRIRFEDGIERDLLQSKIDVLLNAETIPATRKRKRKTIPYDMRPLIHDLYISEDGDFIAHLSVGDQGNLRPDLLLIQMDLAAHYASVHRLRLYFLDD